MQIEPQTRGLDVIKLYFVVPGKKIAICDIEYKEVPDAFYADKNLVTTMNNHVMFHCQSIQAFYAEKEILYNTYSEQCRVHNCKETSDKPECKECNFFTPFLSLRVNAHFFTFKHTKNNIKSNL